MECGSLKKLNLYNVKAIKTKKTPGIPEALVIRLGLEPRTLTLKVLCSTN
jgi:hypothetical protein